MEIQKELKAGDKFRIKEGATYKLTKPGSIVEFIKAIPVQAQSLINANILVKVINLPKGCDINHLGQQVEVRKEDLE